MKNPDKSIEFEFIFMLNHQEYSNDNSNWGWYISHSYTFDSMISFCCFFFCALLHDFHVFFFLFRKADYPMCAWRTWTCSIKCDLSSKCIEDWSDWGTKRERRKKTALIRQSNVIYFSTVTCVMYMLKRMWSAQS